MTAECRKWELEEGWREAKSKWRVYGAKKFPVPQYLSLRKLTLPAFPIGQWYWEYR